MSGWSPWPDRAIILGVMTAFGDIFRSPKIEGEDENGENGQRGSIVGLDLDSGVVRVRPTDSASNGQPSAERPGEDPTDA